MLESRSLSILTVPFGECHAVHLAVLRSYENVSRFTVSVEDTTVRKTLTQPQAIDCVWEPRLSICHDLELTPDDTGAPGPLSRETHGS